MQRLYQLFETIKGQNIHIMETNNAMNQKSIGLNMKNKSLFYSNAETANWYDILSVTLYSNSFSTDFIESVEKLNVQETSPLIEGKPMLIVSSFNKHDL